MAKKTEKSRRVYRDDQIAAMKKRGYHPVPDVAASLHVAPSTVYRWLDDSKIEGTQVGAARYVKLASVVKYVGPQAAAAFGL